MHGCHEDQLSLSEVRPGMYVRWYPDNNPDAKGALCISGWIESLVEPLRPVMRVCRVTGWRPGTFWIEPQINSTMEMSPSPGAILRAEPEPKTPLKLEPKRLLDTICDQYATWRTALGADCGAEPELKMAVTGTLSSTAAPSPQKRVIAISVENAPIGTLTIKSDPPSYYPASAEAWTAFVDAVCSVDVPAPAIVWPGSEGPGPLARLVDDGGVLVWRFASRDVRVTELPMTDTQVADEFRKHGHEPDWSDPLDVKTDGVTLRDLIRLNEDWQRERTWTRFTSIPCFTTSQRTAISAHWSTQLRAKVAASEADRKARAVSVVVDLEDL